MIKDLFKTKWVWCIAVLMLILLKPQEAKAENMGVPGTGTMFKVTANQAGGYVDIQVGMWCEDYFWNYDDIRFTQAIVSYKIGTGAEVPIFWTDNTKYDDDDGFQLESRSDSYITYNGTRVTTKVSGWDLNGGSSNESGGSHAANYTIYFATVRWYVPQDIVGQNFTFLLRGTWIEEGSTYDNTYYDRSLASSFPSLLNATTLTHSNTFGSIGGKITITVNNCNTTYPGKIYCTQGGTEVDNVPQSGASVTLNNVINNPTTAPANDVAVHQRYYIPNHPNGIYHFSPSATVKIPAYPQPTGFKTVFNADTRKVEIGWSVVTVSGTASVDFRSGGTFEIQRADNSSFTNPTSLTPQLSYDNAQNSYFFEDKYFENQSVAEKTYYYRIRRSNSASQWGWTVLSTSNTAVNTKHAAIDTNFVKIVYDSVTNRAVITWKQSGTLWFDNQSQFIIKRTNLTTSTENILLDTRDLSMLKKDTFVDNMISYCNIYRYWLEVRTNNSRYTNPPSIGVKDSILPVKLGKLVSFETDKGYNPDKVFCQWAYQGEFDEFIIKRKPYFDATASWQTAAVVLGVPNQTSYSHGDIFGEPGVIYTYTITGQKHCIVNHSSNILEDIGFRRPVGTASGHVQYGSGTSVPNVRIAAMPFDVTDNANSYRSIKFDGNANAYMKVSDASKVLSSRDDFAFQTYINPTAKSGNILHISHGGTPINLKYNASGNLEFTVGGLSIVGVDTLALNTYRHITATYQKGGKVTLFINGMFATDADCNPTLTAYASTDSIVLGQSFNGYLDEVRLWTKSLDSAQIANNYSSYLVGNDNSLAAYYRFEEAVNDAVYDMSRTGSSNYHKHNAVLLGGASVLLTDVVPSYSQLAPAGITDHNGDYVITAIPYAGNGTTYRFVPAYGVHEFNPTNKLRMIGPNTLVQGDVDFEDVSSFKVWGKVLYAGTTVPVSGVHFIVDGQNPCMKDGRLIETDANGEFEISVPIGWHFVTANKQGHIFTALRGSTSGYVQNSRFPADSLTRYDFQTIEELNFEDNTLVELVGRFVGGPVEGKKPVGFGLSKNNIGKAQLRFTLATKQGLLNDETTPVVVQDTSSSGRIITTKTIQPNTGGNRVEVTTDPNTGEFVAWLLPEQYMVNADDNYDIKTTTPANTKMYSSVVDMKISRETIKLHDSDTSQMEISQDTKRLTDSIECNQKMDVVLRLTPSIEVLNKLSKDGIFGEKEYVVKTSLGDLDTLLLVDEDNNYVLNRPVFLHQKTYHFEISVFEEYANNDGGSPLTDRVPTVDGVVICEDDMGTEDFPFAANLDKDGKATIQRGIGIPNVMTSSQDANESYVRNFNFKVQFSDGTPTQVWNPNPMKAYVLGSKSDGNNFVTKGPKEAVVVLRDPPGSNSYAWLEEGTTTTHIDNWGWKSGAGVQENLKISSGLTLKTFAGMGAGTINDNKLINEFNLIGSVFGTDGRNSTNVSTHIFNKSFYTSADPEYVGPDADIFIGKAYNIIFGEARVIDILDAADATDPINQTITSLSGKTYSIGSDKGFFFVPEFETDFAFTRKHIEQNLIPNLENIRNSYLIYDPSLPTVNNNDYPIYISKLSPNSLNFGKSNTDTCFGEAAEEYAKDRAKNIFDPTKAPSYYIVIPSSWAIGSIPEQDSVYFYNAEITSWQQVLAQDEKARMNATLKKNVSFDAGVVWEETDVDETVESREKVWDVSEDFSFIFKLGGLISDVGLLFETTVSEHYEYYDSDVEETTTSKTTGWHLEDNNSSDYLTVDIKKDKDGYAVFFLKGGQTSCPYEGEIVSKYEKPGTVLQQATSMVQDPYMTISPQTRTEVPGNRPALFNMTVGNGSLVSGAWYILSVDEKTNPNGLIVEMDGRSIDGGKVFSFNPTESFNKTLSVRRTRQDITEYDSIRLILRSDCQEDLYDDLYFSVHFLPSCTDLVLERPVNNRILNNITGDSTDFEVSSYDVNYLNFDHIVLEYRRNTVNNFTPWFYYYKDQASYDAATGVPAEQKALIDTDLPGQTYIKRMWNAPQVDGTYLVRARAVCPRGAADEVLSFSDEIRVIKDMVSPVVFGTPQPANGILGVGNDIVVTFNEDIDADNTYRIDIQGELNGEEIKHNSGLSFDGVNDYVEVSQPTNLSGKSFTVEMWTIRDGQPKNSVLFSHGDADEKFELGLDANDRLWVRVNNDSLNASFPVLEESTNTGIGATWNHISAVYSNTSDGSTVSVLVNGKSNTNLGGIEPTPVEAYNATNAIRMGTNIDQTVFYNGKMHEVRLWSKALSSQRLVMDKDKKLSGREAGLIGYWKMDEARGTLVEENIRGKHGITNASWYVSPAGKSLAFDGNDDYAKANIFPEIEKEADFSVEFWFKADANNSNACLISTGRGDNGDYNTNYSHFSLFFNSNKELVLRSDNKMEVINGNWADDDWHHFALCVNSRGNANIFVDANLQTSLFSNDFFRGFDGLNLYLGGMGWQKSSFNDTVAHFFKGNIDDLRIWKSALTREGIKIAASSRLSGDEIGLRAYYPFDTMETVVLIHGTTFDQMQLTRIENGDEVRRNAPITLHGGAAFSNTAANIKPNRRLQNVQFERVYKSDQIALNLLAEMASIENCVLEISVADVRDMQGNIIKSPVKWTAFIDRNFLKWSEEKLSFVKDVFAPLSFTVEVLNRSGLEQMFTLENLPTWLSASRSSGAIPPTGKLEITFTVNEGLNIGIYDENIYLRNSSGFNELLALDLRVIGEQPDWKVDANAYSYSMNIFGELNIKGVVSADMEDILAAFDSTGNTCLGVTKLRYVPEYDRYLAFLNVYGNQSGGALKFKIWDASTGIVYSQILPDTLRFIENSYLGTAKNPITFRALNIIEQMIPVSAGWNWISTNVTKADMSPQGVLGGNSFAQNDHLKSQQAGIFTNYTNGTFPPFNGNTPINNAEMYMLKAATAKTVVITGEPVRPEDVTVTIHPRGWTWIGFTPQINLSLNEAFAGLNPHDGDLVKSQNAFSVYYEGSGGWLGTLNYLSPGNGYLYNSQDSAQRSFFYPSVSVLANNRKSLHSVDRWAITDAELGVARNKYQSNLTLIAKLDAGDIAQTGAKIVGYGESECLGYGQASYVQPVDENLYFITISGDKDGQKLDFRFQTTDGEVYGIHESLSFASNQTLGSIEEPIRFTLGEAQKGAIRSLTAYPVPFTSSLTLSYRLDEEAIGDVVFQLTDVMGRLWATIEQTQTASGVYTLSLDNYISALSQGVYFVKMTTSAGVETVKIVKSR